MDEREEIRLNKYLSEAGYCARREADRLISEGKVKVDDETATLGTKVKTGQRVEVEGIEVKLEKSSEKQCLYAFYKPVGIISSLSDNQGEGLKKYLNGLPRVFPIGRLDKDSEGLILLTNDGDLMNSVLKAENLHEKEYEVTVDKKIGGEFLKNMESGVRITNAYNGKKVVTAPCRVRKTSEKSFNIVLTQGMNRQIRRMCGELGYKVVKLKRIRIMNVFIDDLKPGQLRKLSAETIREMKK